MIAQDYGTWLVIMDTKDVSVWILYDNFKTAKLNFNSDKKLIYKYVYGKKVASCWLSIYHTNKIIKNADYVIDAEEELYETIILALNMSERTGGNTYSIGLLKAPEKV